MSRNIDNANLFSIIEVLEVSGVLTGFTICVSGHLSIPRKDLERIIIQAGGVVHRDVSRTTNMLVSNSDWTSTNLRTDRNGLKKSSKMMKAENNNRFCSPDKPRTKIICENDFLQMIINKCSSGEKDR